MSGLGVGQSSVPDDPRGARQRARRIALHTCIRQVRVDLDHDAVMRIGGKAPRRQAHSLRRRASHACLGSPPPRIVQAARAMRRQTVQQNRFLEHLFPACSRRSTGNAGPRRSCTQLPQCNQQLVAPARQSWSCGWRGLVALHWVSRALSFWNIKKRQANCIMARRKWRPCPGQAFFRRQRAAFIRRAGQPGITAPIRLFLRSRRLRDKISCTACPLSRHQRR